MSNDTDLVSHNVIWLETGFPNVHPSRNSLRKAESTLSYVCRPSLFTVCNTISEKCIANSTHTHERKMYWNSRCFGCLPDSCILESYRAEWETSSVLLAAWRWQSSANQAGCRVKGVIGCHGSTWLNAKSYSQNMCSINIFLQTWYAFHKMPQGRKEVCASVFQNCNLAKIYHWCEIQLSFILKTWQCISHANKK